MKLANSEIALNLPKYIMTSKEDLSMVVLQGKEGIGFSYSAKLTFQQCADFFEIEDEAIPSRERIQRDADSSRVKNIYTYLIERNNTIFSSACLIVTQLEMEMIQAGAVNIFKAVLPAKSDRVFIDGQGRLSALKKAIIDKPEIAEHHLDVKIIVVPTKTVRESSAFICQIFSDLNSAKNPNISQGIYFDNELSSSRLAKELLNKTQKMGFDFGDTIAVNGKIKEGQLYTLANFIDFIQIIVGENSKSKLNSTLDNKEYYDLNLFLISNFLEAIYKSLPLKDIQTSTTSIQEREKCVITCAIGLKALAYVGRSLVEEMLINEETQLGVSSLQKVNELPLHNRENKLWIDKEIYQFIDKKLKIVRASEKRLARVICHKMRVMPCESLT